jgi:hypothetical protein
MYQLLVDKIIQLRFVNSDSTIELNSVLDELKNIITSNYRNITPFGVSQKESDENGNLVSSIIDKLSEAQKKELKYNFPTTISDEEHSFNSKKEHALATIDGFNMFVKAGLVVKK